MSNNSSSLKAQGRAFKYADLEGDPTLQAKLGEIGNRSRAFFFEKNEVISFPSIEEEVFDLRSITLNKKDYPVLYAGAVSSVRGEIWVPISTLRRTPTEGEVTDFFEASPVSKEMCDSCLVSNDYDRVVRLCGRAITGTPIPNDRFHADLFKRDPETGTTVVERAAKPFYGYFLTEIKTSVK